MNRIKQSNKLSNFSECSQTNIHFMRIKHTTVWTLYNIVSEMFHKNQWVVFNTIYEPPVSLTQWIGKLWAVAICSKYVLRVNLAQRRVITLRLITCAIPWLQATSSENKYNPRSKEGKYVAAATISIISFVLFKETEVSN